MVLGLKNGVFVVGVFDDEEKAKEFGCDKFDPVDEEYGEYNPIYGTLVEISFTDNHNYSRAGFYETKDEAILNGPDDLQNAIDAVNEIYNKTGDLDIIDVIFQTVEFHRNEYIGRKCMPEPEQSEK